MMNSTSLSQVYRDLPIPPDHIIPLDFETVQAVPDSHAWPESDLSFSGPEFDERSSIPIVDLRDPNVTEIIGRACETWGVFQLTGHGIPSRLLEDVVFEARRLFSLPTRQKIRALRSPECATGYGLPRISQFFSKFMWYEGFTIIGSPIDHARELWPHDYERFCDLMEDYQKKMKVLAEKLLLLILEWLQISKEDMNCVWSTHESDGSSTALQLNSYPSCPDPNRAMGLAPHTDTSLFTILHQSDTSGLQVLREGIGWVTVYPASGGLVVNVGDLLHILSNGEFRSVLHRAVVNRTQHRVSVAYFYGMPANARVSPISKAVDSGKVPRYRSVMVKEYVNIKAKHLNKALSLIKI